MNREGYVPPRLRGQSMPTMPVPPEPVPIDPTLPGWARGIIAVFSNPGVIQLIGQLAIIATIIWGGDKLNEKVNRVEDRASAVVEKQEKQTAELEAAAQKIDRLSDQSQSIGALLKAKSK